MTARTLLAGLVVSLTLAAAAGCSSPAASPVTPAPVANDQAPTATGPTVNCTIGFDGFTVHGAGYTGHGDCGLKITPTLGNWHVWTTYGAPAPFVQFFTTAGATEVGEITLHSGDGPFIFTSVDLYSSVTKIPWSFTGELGGVTVFTASDTQPNTFGGFATIVSPHHGALIDVLRIRLTNPGPPCCANPMGLDNIRVVR